MLLIHSLSKFGHIYFKAMVFRPELAKSANSLNTHNLFPILETAIRATSAKFDDLDVQRRLYVRSLAPSENETGWDVFVLDYNVDGPIGTVRIIWIPACGGFNKLEKVIFTNFTDTGTLSSNLSNGLFLIVAGEKDGVYFIRDLETANYLCKDIPKNARSTSNTKSHTFDHQ